VLFAIRQAVLQSKEPVSLAESASGQGLSSTALAPNGAPEPFGVCVAFTSAMQQEGVSFLVRNLASEAAKQASSRVAVLDTRALLQRFEAGSKLPTRFEQDSEHWTLGQNESFVPAEGAVRRAGMQGHFSNDLRVLLQQARREFDMVLLDCPSLQSSTLAGELAPCVDGYVVVVEAGTVRKQNIEDLSSQLASTRKPVLGYVLNRRDYPVPRWLHRMI
jgi:Mrp family chromosome partitioning ATPase